TCDMRILALALALGGVTIAQVETGTISGLVRDSSGGAVPTAQVVLKDELTGLTTHLLTNQAGLYVSPPLRTGSYPIEVPAKGFDADARRVQLDVPNRLEVDFALVVGSVTETVAVPELAGVLQTETSTLSNLRTEKAIQDLPLNSRNFAQLITLSPSAMPAQS